MKYEQWVVDHTLVNYVSGRDVHGWPRAVEQANRVFPGTFTWLMSCSSAEGGWGRFVLHGGARYYPGAEYAKGGREVGGNMQYTYGTFRGHYRRAIEYVRERGYFLDRTLQEVSPGTWQSAAAQALAAAWARYTGNDNSHWSASWSNGC